MILFTHRYQIGNGEFFMPQFLPWKQKTPKADVGHFRHLPWEVRLISLFLLYRCTLFLQRFDEALALLSAHIAPVTA